MGLNTSGETMQSLNNSSCRCAHADGIFSPPHLGLPMLGTGRKAIVFTTPYAMQWWAQAGHTVGISGSYRNSPYRVEHDETRGKWDYFPHANGSTRADWSHRNCAGEIYLLLEPAKRKDPKPMSFDE